MTVIKGDAYILRTCRADMTSHGGFVWPREGKVEAPDWRQTAECGNGLHGFMWGEGSAELADWSEYAVWIVARISEWIDLGGKVKFPRADVVFAGSRNDATQEIIRRGARGAVMGVSLTGGDDSTLNGGDYSALTGGRYSTLNGGDDSTLTGRRGSTLTGGRGSTLNGGDYSALNGGDHSVLTGGDHSALTGGRYSTLNGGHSSVLTGGDDSTLTGRHGSTLTGGRYSILQLFYWDVSRPRIATAYVGENGIKPNTPYRLNNHHEFEEVNQ